MKYRLIIVLILNILIITSVNASETEIQLKTNREKISYLVGRDLGNNIKGNNIAVDLDVLIAAVKEVLDSKPSRYTDEEARNIEKKYRENQKNKQKAGTGQAGFNENLKDMSYVAGRALGSRIKNSGITPDFSVVKMAMIEAMDKKPPRFNSEESKKIVMEFRENEMKKRAVLMLGDKAWKVQLKKPEMMTFDKDKDYFWVLETSKGTIRLKLMPDVAPMHVTSTVFLTKKGFYDGLTFHRVIKGFMAQGGCPLGDGTAGPGYQYDGEFSRNVRHDKPYLLSMANAGPGTDGSQFFITFKATPDLDGKHTIFGYVVDGRDVVRALEAAGGTGPNGIPRESLVINKAAIEEKVK